MRSSILLIGLLGCSPAAPVAAPPPPPAPALIEATATPTRLSAADLAALDEDAEFGVVASSRPEPDPVEAPPPSAPAPVAARPRASAPPLPQAQQPAEAVRPYRFPGWEEGLRGFDRIGASHDRGETVVVYFRQTTCAGCEVVEQEFFKDPRIASWLRKHPRVHVNLDDGVDSIEIARMLGVRRGPIVVVMPGGNTQYTRLHPFLSGGKQSAVQFRDALVAAAALR